MIISVQLTVLAEDDRRTVLACQAHGSATEPTSARDPRRGPRSARARGAGTLDAQARRSGRDPRPVALQALLEQAGARSGAHLARIRGAARGVRSGARRLAAA